MAKRKKSQVGNLVIYTVIICILVGVALGGYYKMMKRQQDIESARTPKTETDKLIAKDLESGYPDTPAEVMKLWGRYNQCMYNTAMSDEQFTALLEQMRRMYSSELLDANPEVDHGTNLREEIEDFREQKSKIVSYSADTGGSVQYKTVNNKECAYLQISYFISKKDGYSKVFEDFLMVKEDDKWKILGFKMDGSGAVS